MSEELKKKLNTGLTKSEVEERVRLGQVNGDLNVKTKTYGQIVKENLFTLFNLKKFPFSALLTVVSACSKSVCGIYVVKSQMKIKSYKTERQ